MKQQLHRRIEHLIAQIPEGCIACRDWPLVRIVRDGDPDGPLVCDRCGRQWHGLTRVYLIDIDPDLI